MSEKMENGSVSPELKELKYEDVLANAKEYFKGDDLAAMVWVNKYALKDSFNRIYEASPEDMHHRIAEEIARIENNYPNPMSAEDVFGLLDQFRYWQQPANCIVVQLFRYRPPQPCRLLRRYYPYG